MDSMFFNQGTQMNARNNQLGLAPIVATAVAQGANILKKAKKALAKVQGLIGGVKDDRFINAKIWINKTFTESGYPYNESKYGVFKIYNKVIPNRKTSDYSEEYERLRKYSIFRLNEVNPGLGDYYNAIAPAWIMKNKGATEREQMDQLVALIKKYPPGTYRGQEVMPTNTTGNAGMPTNTQSNEAINANNNQPQQPTQAGMNTAVGIGLAVLIIGGMIYAGNDKKKQDKKKQATS